MIAIRLCSYACVVLSSLLSTVATAAPQVIWARSYGWECRDTANALSIGPDGSVFVTGRTFTRPNGPLQGAPAPFVVKFDSDGTFVWSKQVALLGSATPYGASSDSQGGVYIAGYTKGSLAAPTAGSRDAFVSRFGADGSLLWTRQFGTETDDIACGIASDSRGAAYVLGETAGSLASQNVGHYDVFVTKMTANGSFAWMCTLGTDTTDEAAAISVGPNDNLYVAGCTGGPLGGEPKGYCDVFVGRLTADGDLLWVTQIGTEAADEPTDIAVDGYGNVYVVGRTKGALGDRYSGGTHDGFVSKFDRDGNLLWTKQLGTPDDDFATAVAADPKGNVFVAGSVSWEYYDEEHYVKYSFKYAFIKAFDPSGNLLWTWQFDPKTTESIADLYADDNGFIYLLGNSYCDISEPIPLKYGDFFVAKLTPEPATLTLLALAVVPLALKGTSVSGRQRSLVDG